MEKSTTNQNNVADIISDNNEKSQEPASNIIQQAIEKIKTEYESFTGGNKEKAVSSYVSTILQDFCKQDERFAGVILKFKRTLSDCCAEVMKGVGNHISDIDVYRHAVKFYFPNSEILMNMSIEITGDEPSEAEILKEAEKPKPKQTKTANKPKSDNAKNKQTTTSKAKTEKAEKREFMQLSLF